MVSVIVYNFSRSVCYLAEFQDGNLARNVYVLKWQWPHSLMDCAWLLADCQTWLLSLWPCLLTDLWTYLSHHFLSFFLAVVLFCFLSLLIDVLVFASTAVIEAMYRAQYAVQSIVLEFLVCFTLRSLISKWSIIVETIILILTARWMRSGWPGLVLKQEVERIRPSKMSLARQISRHVFTFRL